MTSSKVFSSRFLAPDAVRNNAPATSEVARSLSGRSRLLWELAHGATAVAGELAAIERNPQGLLGVDYSGPPFGPCLLLPVAWWQGQSGAAGVIAPASPLSFVDSTLRSLTTWRFFNRLHVVHSDDRGPLQQLEMVWRATAGAGTSSTYSIAVSNLTTGREMSTTRAINTTTETSYRESALVPVAAGENVLEVRMQRTAGSRNLNVNSLALCVGAKRRHGLSFPG